jgi:rfaE bifunctional protein kinase chain/domain/rfaE bifunctional protein nucleotidyltransferase chain/domain
MKGIIQSKIKTLSGLAKIVDRLKKDGKKIVLCYGIFDLIHPGHIRHLKLAKNCGDVLVVVIPSDKFVNKGPGRPIFRQELRSEVLSAMEMIDFIAVVNFSTPSEIIKKIKPHIFVNGPDGKNEKVSSTEKVVEDIEAVLHSVGAKLIMTDDNLVYSSSKIINDHLAVFPPKTQKYLEILKHKYSAETVLSTLQSYKKLKILILGETIIDQYYYCRPLGKSSKEPVMVNQYISDESFAGGVLATANHTASLSDNITLVTVLGKKQSFHTFITQKLRPTIKPIFFYQSGESTIVKRRFVDMDNKQKLFQISYLNDQSMLSEKVEKEILKYLKTEIQKFDLVIVNDFGHGMFTKKITKLICAKAKYLTLNVQANSANYGFNVITKYLQADFVCIDEQEIRLATHDKYSELLPLVRKIYHELNCKFMIVTRGHKGSIAYSDKSGFLETPALTDRIVDRVGAGDALFAVASPCVYSGMAEDLIPFIANVAGAIKVQVVGNRKQIDFPELEVFINRLLN